MGQTDESLCECTLEHGCPAGRDCQLGGFLATVYAVYRRPSIREAVDR